jgi:hypothetical protein
MNKTDNEDFWQAIQRRHFGQCLWRQRSPSGLVLLQAMIHKASGEAMLIELQYDHRLPPRNSSKPWPALIGLQIYASVDPDGTWAELDQALTDFKVSARANGQTCEPAPSRTA